MKHRLLFSLFLVLLCLTGSAAAIGPAGSVDVQYYDNDTGLYGSVVQADAVHLTLNGKPLAGPSTAFIRMYSASQGRTLFPLRMVGEALNAQVIWVSGTNQAMLIHGENTIVLTLGAADALVNGQTVPLPDGVPACLVKYNGLDTTMVPARFVVEQLGAQVSWDGESYTAAITAAGGPPATVLPTPPEKGDLGYLGQIICDDNAQSIYAVTDHLPEYAVTELDNRVVIDLLGAQLGRDLSDGQIPIENDLISAVRYAQHGSDLDNGYQHTVRLVLDLMPGISLAQNLALSREAGGLRIETALAPEQKPHLPTNTPSPSDPYRRTVVLDAGHGGTASGAVYENIKEKDLTLAMTLKLYQLLVDQGYRVILTRSDDSSVDLYQRAEIANAAQADIFVSIHCNATTVSGDYDGLYTYYFPGSTRGQQLANLVQIEACAATGARDRGLMNNNFVVLRETSMPAVLVETGFMTCHEELMRLSDPAYQQKVAAGVANGIIRYLNTLD